MQGTERRERQTKTLYDVVRKYMLERGVTKSMASIKARGEMQKSQKATLNNHKGKRRHVLLIFVDKGVSSW